MTYGELLCLCDLPSHIHTACGCMGQGVGHATADTLLYGVEVKFYNMEVDIDENLETRYKGLYIIGDGSGVTHSLSHASASGVYVARKIAEAE